MISLGRRQSFPSRQKRSRMPKESDLAAIRFAATDFKPKPHVHPSKFRLVSSVPRGALGRTQRSDPLNLIRIMPAKGRVRRLSLLPAS